jgi:hypothetical protein
MPITCITAALVQEIIRSYGQVRKLNLSSNAIERVEELEALTSLIKLNLAANQLTSNSGCLEGLLRLTALEELDLSCNEIRQLDVFSHHVIQQQQPDGSFTLHSLNLADNHISDLAQIVHLQQLRSLTKLQLTGNPLCNTMNYRAKVKALLPQLLVLDDEPLSDDRSYSSSSSSSSSNSNDSSSISSDHSSSSSSSDACGYIAEDVADAGNHIADSLSIDHQVSVAAAGELAEPATADATVPTATPATAIALAAQVQSISAAAVVDESCTDDVLAGLAILSPVDAQSAGAESTSVTAAMPTIAAAETDTAVAADTAVTEQAGDIDVSNENTLQQQQEQQQPQLQQQQQLQQHAVDSSDVVNAHVVILSDTDHNRTDTVAVTLDDDCKTVHINDSNDAAAAASSHTMVTAAAADNGVNAAAVDSSAGVIARTNDDNNSQLNSHTASSDDIAQVAMSPAIDSVHECNGATISDTTSPITPTTTAAAARDTDAVSEQQQHVNDAPAVLHIATGSIDDTSSVVASNDAGSSIDSTQLHWNVGSKQTLQHGNLSSDAAGSTTYTVQQDQQRSKDNSAHQRLPQLYNATAVAAPVHSGSHSNTSNSSMSSSTVQQPTSTATVRSTAPLAPITAPTTSSSDADTIACLKREVALLTVQNAAMKRAALMADTAITASSAHVNATQQQQQQQQHTVTRIRRQPWVATTDNDNSSNHDSDTVHSNDAAVSTDGTGDKQQPQQHDDTTIDDDKYVKLLNQWRHEVVKLLMQQASQQVC